MIAFIIRKFLLLIPMLLVISFLIFLGIELMPGDAVDFMIPPDAL
ncbi:ABC transporter permease, partial [Sphaerochaeta sp. S2]|nr:ABC transporter permease [Sphaerochaeta sp. S2]